MIIEPLTAESADASTVEELQGMLPHLTNRSIDLQAALQRTLADPASTLIVARLKPGTPVMGMVTLVLYNVPTGMRARIEDLVVDPQWRGSGVGAQLVDAAVAHARRAGADVVDLTSNPQREAANRLYLRLGFVPWQTNVYRLPLQPGAAASASENTSRPSAS
jgi:ribosomal protein S18 acetylase RimI-like enzyme